MRIALDASKALAPRDGIGRVTHELLGALAALDRDDELVLFGLPPGLDEASGRERLGGLPERFRLCPGPLRDDAAVDLLHATTWEVPPHPPCPLLLTCYDLTFSTHPASHTLANKVHCWTGVLRARLHDADFLAISRATADDLRRHLQVPDERLHVVYPAPPASLEPRDPAAARRQIQETYGTGGAPILTVGTLEPRKNLARLLDAYTGLDDGLRAAHPLLIAGGGGWKNRALLERCAEIPGVHLLGFVDDAGLARLYSAAHVFAYPSLAEGFGLPVVEAMRCGAPVLTSDVPALSEVAGGAAHLVDPLDPAAIRAALAVLLTDGAERRRLRELGRVRAAKFSWARAARETSDLYHLLVPSRNRGSR